METSWSTSKRMLPTDWNWHVASLSPPLPSLKCDNSCMGQPRVWNTFTGRISRMETSKASGFLSRQIPLSDIQQANILISNSTPPRACLTDFGFMTMVLDPGQPMSCSVGLEGGTLGFMSPELSIPSKFGTEDSIPTPEGDIYAFSSVIFQVNEQGLLYRSFLIFPRS